MVSLWDAWRYGLLFLLATLPLLWKCSAAFRYFAKMSAFYFCIALDGVLLFPAVLPWPGDPDNYKTVSWIFRHLCAWVDIEWEVRGGEALEGEEPFLIVSNHQSSLDLLGMMTVQPDRCVALIKSSLLYLPWREWAWRFGPAAWLSGSVFVDRANTTAALATMDKTVHYIREKKVKLWVFPEGTRNHGKGFLPFKKGGFHMAVQAQIPVVPIVFSSFEPFYSKPERRFRLGGKVIVEVLPPIPTTTDTDVARLADETRSQMIAAYERINPLAAAQQPWIVQGH